MDIKHLSSAVLERVRRGAASAEETEAVGQHVAQCEECAGMAGRALSVAESVAAFRAAFAEEPEPRRSFGVLKTVVPLAAAAAIAAVVLLIPRETERPRPVTPAPRVTATVPNPPTLTPARNAEWDALLAETRRTGVLPFPAEIRKLADADRFRGDPSEGAAEEVEMWPVATAVAEQQPELRWPAKQGATSIVTVSSRGEEIARSGELAAARWRVPVALRRGRMYTWQVRIEGGEEPVVLPAPPAPPAIFRVLSAREHEELLRARAEAAGDRLLLGVLYARAGLVEEARRELAAHARETRDPLTARLLRQLP